MDEFFGVKKVFSYDRTKRGLAFHCIAATQLKDFNVVANAGKTNNVVIYDDGKVVDFECSRDDSEITLKIGESNRTYIAKFNKINEPVNVEIKGRKISRCRGEDFEKIKEGWYFDDSNQVLRVKLPVKGIEILKVRMKG